MNEQGGLTGVLDWECVSSLPLWKACDYPRFLHGRPRDTKPDIEMYDKENPDSAYWEHLHEYEATFLRDVFMEEIRTSERGWANVFEVSLLQRGFDTAL